MAWGQTKWWPSRCYRKRPSGLPGGRFAKRTVTSSWTSLLAYVRVAMAHETREQFRVIFLDKKNAIIVDDVMNHGTDDHAPVYPREVIRRALKVGASALILVHNHLNHNPALSIAPPP